MRIEFTCSLFIFVYTNAHIRPLFSLQYRATSLCLLVSFRPLTFQLMILAIIHIGHLIGTQHSNYPSKSYRFFLSQQCIERVPCCYRKVGVPSDCSEYMYFTRSSYPVSPVPQKVYWIAQQQDLHYGLLDLSYLVAQSHNHSHSHCFLQP